MICSAITTLHRNGEPVRVIVIAETQGAASLGPRARFGGVQIFTARDILPFSVASLTTEEGMEIQRLLVENLAGQLGEVVRLPERVRRLAEGAGVNAAMARVLAVEAGTEVTS